MGKDKIKYIVYIQRFDALSGRSLTDRIENIYGPFSTYQKAAEFCLTINKRLGNPTDIWIGIRQLRNPVE